MRRKSAAHGDADLLLYRFLHSAMRDLGDYFWWTELERILCRVFATSAARPAIDAVRRLRANPSALEEYPLPVDKRQGAFYNSLNQVANHAGMNHLVFKQDDKSEYYGPNCNRRRHLINRDYLSLSGGRNHTESGYACRRHRVCPQVGRASVRLGTAAPR